MPIETALTIPPSTCRAMVRLPDRLYGGFYRDLTPKLRGCGSGSILNSTADLRAATAYHGGPFGRFVLLLI